MAELLGRVERLATSANAQQQVTGQGQVKIKSIFTSKNLYFFK
jgi:TfoX/Sxy family transcriptional regulator of competence genes